MAMLNNQMVRYKFGVWRVDLKICQFERSWAGDTWITFVDNHVMSHGKKSRKQEMRALIIYNQYLVGGLEHFLFSISYMGCHPSHWRTHIFQDGYCTTNQVYKSLLLHEPPWTPMKSATTTMDHPFVRTWSWTCHRRWNVIPWSLGTNRQDWHPEAATELGDWAISETSGVFFAAIPGRLWDSNG